MEYFTPKMTPIKRMTTAITAIKFSPINFSRPPDCLGVDTFLSDLNEVVIDGIFHAKNDANQENDYGDYSNQIFTYKFLETTGLFGRGHLPFLTACGSWRRRLCLTFLGSQIARCHVQTGRKQ